MTAATLASRLLAAVSAAACCLYLTACGSPDTADAPLRETQWQLVAIADSVLQREQLEKAQVVFAGDGNRLSGSDGCNRFFGAWTQEHNQIHLDVTGTTRMACPGETAFDDILYNLLRNSDGFRIEGNVLELYDDGELTLRFRAGESTASTPEKPGT